MSTGQMLEDVQLAIGDAAQIEFYGRPGGVVPTPVEFARIIAQHLKTPLKEL